MRDALFLSANAPSIPLGQGKYVKAVKRRRRETPPILSVLILLLLEQGKTFWEFRFRPLYCAHFYKLPSLLLIVDKSLGFIKRYRLRFSPIKYKAFN